MGFRTWLYKKTGIRLKRFEEPWRKEVQALKAENESLKKQLQDSESYLGYCKQFVPVFDETYRIKDEFKVCLTSQAALQKLLEDYQFQSVIDIGAGALEQTTIFAKHGKDVTAVDFGVSVYYQQHTTEDGLKINKIIGNFNNMKFDSKYDCVWASHILEHQPNADQFLKKLISLAKDGGIIAITIPPFKHEIVGGHVSIWNAGLVLYRLVLAGIDCTNASVLSYGYNISIIVRKKTITPQGIEYDCGDIRRIASYLPNGLKYHRNDFDDPFNGNIARLNW